MCLILDLEFKIADSPHPKFFRTSFWNRQASFDELVRKKTEASKKES